MILKHKGEVVDQIPVEISYKIIDLFSAGLYSSPNKAFEELVSNSYDAGATKVATYIPADKAVDNGYIWVCDNGESMDSDGLKDLWKIGESPKETTRKSKIGDRYQIGKFGIGKLATYILTNELTYICKTSDGYRGVTMNFDNVKAETKAIFLDEVELTKDQAQEILLKYIIVSGKNIVPFELFGDTSEKSWTFTILSNLKPKVTEIRDGRLKWILSTALPLNPNFKLYFNGRELKSSKVKTVPWKTWIIGDDDTVVQNNLLWEEGTYGNKPCVNLPGLKNITGRFDLYHDSLLTGVKSERLGRSHGIFVIVRGRLINLDDALFGMDALSHGAFNRVRIEIHADDLDENITSTREAIKDSVPRKDLVAYIKKKFAEVKDWYFNKKKEDDLKNRAAYKIAHTDSSYSRRPLLIAAKKYFSKDISGLWLTDLPTSLSESEKAFFLTELEEGLTNEIGIIKDVEWSSMGPDNPMAKLDLLTGVAKINSLHPFFSNFLEEVRSPLPFKLIALTEILTEATMIEHGISETIVRDVMYGRDQIFRELTYSDRPNAPYVANLLKDTVADPDGLEDALAKAFASLGFETTPIGGNGEPDGLAVAYLEHSNSDKNYKFTYDAKSTKKEKIMAGTARISAIDRHRRKYEAQFGIVVAIDFQGAKDRNSAINDEAKALKVNLIRIRDLVKLILLAGPKQLGLNKIRDFLENCHTVIETEEWINNLETERVERGPIKEILQVAHELTRSDLAVPNVTSIRMQLGFNYPKFKVITPERIKDILQSLETLVPGYVSLSGERFSINNTPEVILKELNRISSDSNIPIEFYKIYKDSFNF